MSDERMSSEYSPMRPRATVITGRTRCEPMSMIWSNGPVYVAPAVSIPKAGNQWSVVPNRTRKIMPGQK